MSTCTLHCCNSTPCHRQSQPHRIAPVTAFIWTTTKDTFTAWEPDGLHIMMIRSDQCHIQSQEATGVPGQQSESLTTQQHIIQFRISFNCLAQQQCGHTDNDNHCRPLGLKSTSQATTHPKNSRGIPAHTVLAVASDRTHPLLSQKTVLTSPTGVTLNMHTHTC